MKMEIFARNLILLGEEGQDYLFSARVALFGLGGVGSYVAEALTRAGIGEILLVDHDIVEMSNLNRQLFALHSSLGQDKVAVARERLKDINPELVISAKKVKCSAENIATIMDKEYDFIVDAIDDVPGKIALAKYALTTKTPIICSMGTANRISTKGFCFTDISRTDGCPLARSFRKKLRLEGITEGIRVLYNPLPALKGSSKGTISYVPSLAGLLIAEEAVNYLLQRKDSNGEKKDKLL